MPAQPGVIRPAGETQTISVITSPAPPRARAPRWTRWKSVGRPSSAEYMSIGETTTRLASSSRPSRNGWNIGGGGSTGPASPANPPPPPPTNTPAGFPGEPAVHPRDELRVAQLQVVVGDPPAAGDDVEGELLGGLPDVLADVLEPLEAGLPRARGGEPHRPSLRLVRRQRRRHVRVLGQAGDQCQRVLHGQ